MKKSIFRNKNETTVILVTTTNWSEPPRMRHEMAYQLSRFYNVVFFQIYSQRGYKRKEFEVNERLLIKKIGISFTGINKVFFYFPSIHMLYNRYLAYRIEKFASNLSSKNIILLSFQYNFPEVFEISCFDLKIYFCNDDFVSQYRNISKLKFELFRGLQRSILLKSNLVFTVSKPLMRLLIEEGARDVIIVESGHSFDLNISKKSSYFKDGKCVRVCYLGFLTDAIEIDWFLHILNEEHIHLTVIGPCNFSSILSRLGKFKNFNHLPVLTGEVLQMELLAKDVLVMPYRSKVDNNLTTVPAKLFQYLAVGKPIVSSKMDNLIKLPDKFIYMAENHESFLNSILLAFNEDTSDLKNSRIDFAENNTWDERGNHLFNEIANMITRIS